MGVTVYIKICFMTLCLSQIIFKTSAGSATDSVELFKKFFTAAQEFKKAAVAAGGIEKLKQDPKFKEVPPQIMDVVYGAGKALEDLPNPDLAARNFFTDAFDFGTLKKAQDAWLDIGRTYSMLLHLGDATTVKP